MDEKAGGYLPGGKTPTQMGAQQTGTPEPRFHTMKQPAYVPQVAPTPEAPRVGPTREAAAALSSPPVERKSTFRRLY